MAEQLVEVLRFEHVFVRRFEGALCLEVVRAAGSHVVLCVCATLCGETLPAQGGKQVLGTGDVGSFRSVGVSCKAVLACQETMLQV